MARWKKVLKEYDIQYTTQKEIKGSVLTDHLAHQAVADYQSLTFEFPDENIMLVIDCEELRPYEDLSQDPDGLWFSIDLLTHLATKLVF